MNFFLQGVSLVYRLVGTQQPALKAGNKIIMGLRGEVDKLTAEKKVMGEELARLQADMRQHGEEMEQV